jgi:hypothetical protein
LRSCIVRAPLWKRTCNPDGSENVRVAIAGTHIKNTDRNLQNVNSTINGPRLPRTIFRTESDFWAECPLAWSRSYRAWLGQFCWSLSARPPVNKSISRSSDSSFDGQS